MRLLSGWLSGVRRQAGRAAQLEQTAAALRRANQALAAEKEEAVRARAEAARAASRLDEVSRIMHAVLRHESLDAVLHEILDQVQRVLGSTEATILLLDPDGQHLRPRATRGQDEESVRLLVIPVGSGMAGRVAAERRPLIVHDVSEIDIVNPYLRQNVRSLVAVPLLLDDLLIGVLHVGAAARREFSDEDRTFLELVAERVVSIIERARLFEAGREARAAVDVARSAAEAANRARADFVAALSHDLRTPLTAISGYTQLLEMEVHGPITEQQRKDLNSIEKSSTHMLGLLDALLTFAQLEAASVTYELANVSVVELLHSLDVLIAPAALQKRLECEYLPCDPDLQVRGDREKVMQVLLNLLTNAIKFTDSGGRVTVHAEAEPQRVSIHVRDTGAGIPPETMESIFEPFMQASHDGSPRSGIGLGLAIARRLGQGMGGDLMVESTVGRGSTFTLRMPRVGAPEPSSVRSSSAGQDKMVHR